MMHPWQEDTPADILRHGLEALAAYRQQALNAIEAASRERLKREAELPMIDARIAALQSAIMQLEDCGEDELGHQEARQ